jgi:lipopolysaccharide biosynthesis glycosyltransferase
MIKDDADRLGWSDMFDAEYLVLTKLQADAFITLDAELASAVKDVVALAPYEVLSKN